MKKLEEKVFRVSIKTDSNAFLKLKQALEDELKGDYIVGFEIAKLEGLEGWIDTIALIKSIKEIFADKLKREPTKEMIKDFYLDLLGTLGVLIDSFIYYREI